MKIPETPSDYNSLTHILSFIENKEPKPLTTLILDVVISFLSKGDIVCDNREEGIKCLEVIKDMGLITFEKKQGEDGIFYLIGNLYNGK